MKSKAPKTKVMRVPVACVSAIKKLIAEYNTEVGHVGTSKDSKVKDREQIVKPTTPWDDTE